MGRRSSACASARRNGELRKRRSPEYNTVAWCGILSTQPPTTYISVRPKRYSYGLIKESGEFVINLTPASLVRAADYCGIYTGAKVDKFERCGLTAAKSFETACPSIGESPLSIECRVRQIVPLGSHDMFISDIVAIGVEPSLIDSAGKLHLERAGLCAFAHGEYYALGQRIGNFGFSAKKPTKRRR